jgi:hypothetical protein
MLDDKKKEIVISRVRAKRANSFGFSCDLGWDKNLIFIPLNFSVAKNGVAMKCEGKWAGEGVR